MRRPAAALVLMVSFLGFMFTGPVFADQAGGQPSAIILMDVETTYRLYRQAAEQGDAAMQVIVGNMYMSGEGVPRDNAEAAKWYRKAAEQGNAEAQYNLGIMHSNGEGLPKSDAEAARWYRMAADRGNADAQYEIGVMYANGEGVPQDFVLAHFYLDLAARNFGSAENREMAEGYRGFVAAKLTPTQISVAQRMARNWKPKKEK